VVHCLFLSLLKHRTTTEEQGQLLLIQLVVNTRLIETQTLEAMDLQAVIATRQMAYMVIASGPHAVVIDEPIKDQQQALSNHKVA